MVRSTLLLLLLAASGMACGQELFPLAEPASSIPRGVLGVRLMDESYNEVDRIRNLFGIRVMYGLTPRLSVYATPTMSNHHNTTLPPEFPDHNTPQIGVHHPYLFNGVDLYAKYRFLSLDAQNSHFRMAAYGEYSLLHVAHDEAEPTLLDDNSGVGGGLIATYLHHHFAVSATGGIIQPFKYHGEVPDEIAGLPGLPATITYGRGYNYSLSLGYLLFPRAYSSYGQTNWNVYLEFTGKQYAAMQMQVGNVFYNLPQYTLNTSKNKVLQAASYVEINPGVQCIIRSNVRADLAVGFPFFNRSYVHYYPVITAGVQRYFYPRKHKKRH